MQNVCGGNLRLGPRPISLDLELLVSRRGVGGRRRCHLVQVAHRCSAPTPVCRNASAHVHSHSTGGEPVLVHGVVCCYRTPTFGGSHALPGSLHGSALLPQAKRGGAVLPRKGCPRQCRTTAQFATRWWIASALEQAAVRRCRGIEHTAARRCRTKLAAARPCRRFGAATRPCRNRKRRFSGSAVPH